MKLERTLLLFFQGLEANGEGFEDRMQDGVSPALQGQGEESSRRSAMHVYESAGCAQGEPRE